MTAAKLTLHSSAHEESPTEQLLATSNKTYSVQDSTGRVIVLKKPGVLAQFRIVEVCGDSSSNAAYMSMVLPLIFICELGGLPRTQPKSKLQLEGLIEELGDHGCQAVMEGVQKHFGNPDPEADKAAIKK